VTARRCLRPDHNRVSETGRQTVISADVNMLHQVLCPELDARQRFRTERNHEPSRESRKRGSTVLMVVIDYRVLGSFDPRFESAKAMLGAHAMEFRIRSATALREPTSE
jgi:hypothetical protein